MKLKSSVFHRILKTQGNVSKRKILTQIFKSTFGYAMLQSRIKYLVLLTFHLLLICRMNRLDTIIYKKTANLSLLTFPPANYWSTITIIVANDFSHLKDIIIINITITSIITIIIVIIILNPKDKLTPIHATETIQ